MRWTTITICVTRPLFSGTAPGERLAIPGIRGVLGFWLRALLGASIGENTVALATAQSRILGIGGKNPRRSPIALRWARTPPTPFLDEPTDQLDARRPLWLYHDTKRDRRRTGLIYLLGQGLWKHPNKHTPDPHAGLQRPWLPDGAELLLAARIPDDPTVRDHFHAALWLLHHYGALGARGRRGFGTVTVDLDDDVPDWWHQAPHLDPDTGLPAALAHLVPTPPHPGALAPVPAYPRFGTCAHGPTALGARRPLTPETPIDQAHDQLGTNWRRLRADHTGERNRFTTEYREVIVEQTSTQCPLANLGLPIGFGKDGPTVNLHNPDGSPLRLASPHWLRPDTDAHHLLSFVHTLRPEPAALRVTRGDTTHTELTGLNPDTIRTVHHAWTTFNGHDSTWRRDSPGVGDCPHDA